jgi:hypothetical protein
VLDIVYRLITWAEGIFQFNQNIVPGDDKIMVPIELENVIIEGARRTRELERLEEELPSLEMALKFSEHPNVNIRNMKLSAEEWRVVSIINPKNTMRAIGKANNLSDMELRRIVYSLLQAGLVEVVRPEGAARPLPFGLLGRKPPPPPTPAEKVVKRGLVNRLIARIRSL